jgi:hypothetical protein
VASASGGILELDLLEKRDGASRQNALLLPVRAPPDAVPHKEQQTLRPQVAH